jgi:transposase
MLRTWKRQVESRAGLIGGDVFPGNGKLTSQEQEIRRLRRELEHAKQENAFLKKAAAYFARESP